MLAISLDLVCRITFLNVTEIPWCKLQIKVAYAKCGFVYLIAAWWESSKHGNYYSTQMHFCDRTVLCSFHQFKQINLPRLQCSSFHFQINHKHVSIMSNVLCNIRLCLFGWYDSSLSCWAWLSLWAFSEKTEQEIILMGYDEVRGTNNSFTGLLSLVCDNLMIQNQVSMRISFYTWCILMSNTAGDGCSCPVTFYLA